MPNIEMVQYIPPPNPRELLPPLLACLPTAFVSPKPPPALTSLLTPILQQRVHLHTTSSQTKDSWLKLLSWDTTRADKLPELIEEIRLEPHPVSGEIEIEDVENIQYRRLDAETLHSRLDLEQFGLLPLYLWCMGDGKGNQVGWKLAELRSREDKEDGTEWFDSIDEADERSGSTQISQARNADVPNGTNGTNGTISANGHNSSARAAANEGEDDDDSYWASYDQAPSETPAKDRSPAPPPTNSNGSAQAPTDTELEYFARYMSEVQPALDPHDPSEEQIAPGQSTLNGNTIIPSTRPPQNEPVETTNQSSLAHDSSHPPPEHNGTSPSDNPTNPISPSSNSTTCQTTPIESKVENSSSQAEIAIKQHISTDMKSLFRLARSAGIERVEFERIIKTELDMLGMMELDE